ncbi:hypothetical protein [Burkholderia sp. LMU1-1-1.1]|uniref:hypothetical protein n=1 Tax=Burkholderia sp. LMU1-1-1.1 TaxID=3135266 RepID=UPI003448F843
MKASLYIALILASLGGCTLLTPTPKVVQTWESPAAEYPAICMLMHEDGTLAFKGGLQFYQPGKWRQEAQTGVMTLTLGGTEPFPADLTKVQLRSKIGALTAYNTQRRELTYKVAPTTPLIALGNFYFYRTDSCSAK